MRLLLAVLAPRVSAPDLFEELAPHLRLLDVAASPERGDRLRVLLAHAAHLRAEMLGLDMDCDAVWLHQRDERVRDLHAQAFLDREAAREQAHEPGQLRDADDLLVRDVSNVGGSGMRLLRGTRSGRPSGAWHHPRSRRSRRRAPSEIAAASWLWRPSPVRARRR